MTYCDPAGYQAGYSQTPYGQTPYGQTPYGQMAYDQIAYGQTPYGQMVDESSTSSTYGQTAIVKDEKYDNRSFTASATVVCATVIFFVFLCALITLFALGSGSSYKTDTADTAPTDANIMQGDDVKVVVVEAANAPAKTAATTPATTAANTPARTAATNHARTAATNPARTAPTTEGTATHQKTETPTASTAAPAEMMDDRPLVCTMGKRLNSTQMFPPDGLCEYIFCDSLYNDGRSSIGAPELFDDNLVLFAEAANAYDITAFGVGIFYDAADNLESFLNHTRGLGPLEFFWANSIYHVGFLDIPTVNPREMDVILALRCLKVLHKVSRDVRVRGNRVFTFFAASVPNSTWADIYVMKFTDLFAPDLFIALGHYPRGDNSLPNCHVMPPTILLRPSIAGESYQHDMIASFNSLERLSASTLALKYALSVTMKGRLAVPKVPTEHGFLTPCVTNDSIDSFASYAEVCKSPNFRSTQVYDPTVHATQIRHVTGHTVFSYDDRVGLCSKLFTVQAMNSTVKFGIAVFDLDYADFSNTCGSKSGPFSRLRLIRSVLNFFRTRFTTREDIADCANLAI